MALSSKQKNFSWSSLPPELLEEISARVPSFSDHVHFRAVCSSWRSSARPRRLVPRLPFLILAPNELSNGSGDFFSFSSKKIHCVDLPSVRYKQCHGSSHGWLFVQHNGSSFSILNPFTRTEIHLPPLVHLPPLYLTSAFISKAILSSDPSLDPECVALIVLPYNTLAFCRVGEEGWTFIFNLQSSLEHIQDIVLHKGKIYIVEQNGRFAYCDLSVSTTLVVVPDIRIRKAEKMYFVEYCGDLYLVLWHMQYFRFRVSTLGFGVWKLDLGNPSKLVLVGVDDMNGCALFIGPYQSMAFSTEGLDGVNDSCIYFVEDRQVDGYVGNIEPRLCIYRLEYDETEELQYDINRFFFDYPESQWIIPSIII